MIRKEPSYVKKALLVLLSLVCMLGVLAGCGQANQDTGKAEATPSEEPAADTWYEVDQEAGILTVRLPSEKEDFHWDFTINDGAVLELITEEDNDNTFVASFRALDDGETEVSFSYAKDDTLEEIRALSVTCKDGKVTDASDGSILPVNERDNPQMANR